MTYGQLLTVSVSNFLGCIHYHLRNLAGVKHGFSKTWGSTTLQQLVWFKALHESILVHHNMRKICFFGEKRGLLDETTIITDIVGFWGPSFRASGAANLEGLGEIHEQNGQG